MTSCNRIIQTYSRLASSVQRPAGMLTDMVKAIQIATAASTTKQHLDEVQGTCAKPGTCLQECYHCH